MDAAGSPVPDDIVALKALLAAAEARADVAEAKLAAACAQASSPPRIKSGVTDIDPQARLPAHPAQQIDELLPRNWGPAPATKDIAA
jgi:hypothetical protein